ncbi:MAG: response regulator [Cyanobacteria bacterium J06598_3]
MQNLKRQNPKRQNLKRQNLKRQTPKRQTPKRQATKRILIVDDEASIQKVVGLSLKLEASWESLTASSGHEGIAQAETHHPDAILLDVMMPELDGISTFEALSANPKTQSIPVILLTAKTGTAEKRLFQSIGVAGVITKPFNPLTLASEMAKLLDWTL